jgi:hypothetical protein
MVGLYHAGSNSPQGQGFAAEHGQTTEGMGVQQSGFLPRCGMGVLSGVRDWEPDSGITRLARVFPACFTALAICTGEYICKNTVHR